jgi:hypothetical protein
MHGDPTGTPPCGQVAGPFGGPSFRSPEVSCSSLLVTFLLVLKNFSDKNCKSF